MTPDQIERAANASSPPAGAPRSLRSRRRDPAIRGGFLPDPGRGDRQAGRDDRRLEGRHLACRAGISPRRSTPRPCKRARRACRRAGSRSSASSARSGFASTRRCPRAPSPIRGTRCSMQHRCIRRSRLSTRATRISARSTGCRSWPTISRMAGWFMDRRRQTGTGSISPTRRSRLPPTASISPTAPGCAPATPIELMLAAVQHANGRGGIAAGTVITTGTHTGLVFTAPGVKIVADYGRLGRVEVSFPK